MTDKQQKFINEVTDKMAKQSNRSTQYPLFYVHEKEEVETTNGDFEFISWRNEDFWEIKRGGDDSEAPAVYEYEIYMKEIDRRVPSVGPFLTEEAAQQHIDQNDYHYNKPFIYVDSCWRNYEMQEVLKLLFTLAGKEIPSCYE